jgi:hypothetical protein
MEGTIMTNKSLILGIVAVCALPAASQAQMLLNENFDSLTPSMEFSGPVGSSFMGTRVSIAGGTFNAGVCRSPAFGHCLYMNNSLGSLTPVPVTLVGGHTYDLSFDLVGNSLTGATTTSEVTVTLGSLFDHTFTLANGTPIDFKRVIDPITVPATVRRESVFLLFKGTGDVNRTAGMVIDNILLVGAPEPATLGLLTLGLLGAGFAGRKLKN